MSSNNDINVKLGADLGELDRGMDRAANVVKTKSNLVNEILRKNAQEAASIARKQAAEMEEQARKQGEAIERATKASADRVTAIGRDLQGRIAGMFSLGAIVGFVNSTKQAVKEAEQSYRGLEAVANYTGVGIGNAMKAAGQLAADGMMTTAEASKALQNLLSRGYSLDQAMNTLTRLKDAAAFNRQASLEMGEAVVNATEGLKNENSILVDNAGVTKNVAKMWEEYAKQHGLVAANLTTDQKIQAEYNGVMAETEAQVGNAAKAMQGMQGEQAKLNVATNNLKISVGQALTPAFTALAQAGTYVVENFAKPMLWAFQAIGIGAASAGVRIGILWDAITSGNFSGVGAKFKAEIANYQSALQDAASAINAPMDQFQASPDSGKRKAAETPAPGKASGSKSKAKKADAPDDVFDNGSFIASDRGVADFIRQQYDAVNGLQGEMVREAERAAAKIVDAQKKSAEQRKQIELLWAQDATAAQLHRVDAAEQAAHQQVEMGLMTKEELLAAEQEFEQRRHEIQLQALNDRLALFAADPSADPVAKAQVLIAIEELERQHQANIAAIRTEALSEQFDPMRAAYQSLEQNMAGTLQRLFTLQTSLGGALKSLWQGVTNAIAGEFAKMTAKIILEKIRMLVFGKAATASEISGQAAKAGAGGVASMAAAPWPLNMTAPAFGAAMSAAAMAFAPVASASMGFDIPAGVNPVTQLHAREMVLPAKHADVIRRMADGGGTDDGAAGDGAAGERPIIINQTNNVSALDGPSVRDVLMDNTRALVDALKSANRDFL